MRNYISPGEETPPLFSDEEGSEVDQHMIPMVVQTEQARREVVAEDIPPANQGGASAAENFQDAESSQSGAQMDSSRGHVDQSGNTMDIESALQTESNDGLRKTQEDDDSRDIDSEDDDSTSEALKTTDDNGNKDDIAAQLVDVTLGSVSDEAQASIQVKEPRDLFAGFLPKTRKQMVANAVHQLILSHQSGLPVSLADLKRVAMGSQHNRLSEILPDAEKALRNVFGMDLIRVDHTHSGLQVASTSRATEVENEENFKRVGQKDTNARNVEVEKAHCSRSQSGQRNVKLTKSEEEVKKQVPEPVRKSKGRPITKFMLVSAFSGNVARSIMQPDVKKDAKD
ncbi:unnamed protein product [Orchesella dallaii]|uniref:Uncharacterized protein n=1 Tax=Orchesella dallaii TaxID=48710 RepID=A0ABP1PVP7_9HEXA